MIEIRDADIHSAEAEQLLKELCDTLAHITGASGAASFATEDMANARSVFVIAYADGVACGCGALRPFTDTTAEIKRVYARPNQRGVGTVIVQALETRAWALGYTALVLETRRINTAAVAFYEKLSYQPCENFGNYIGRPEAICMTKLL